MPANHDFTIYKNETFDKTLTIRDKETESPLDLTGYSADLDVRSSAEDVSEALTFTSGSGLTLGGTNGTVRLQKTASETGALTSGRYVYDLRLVDGSGDSEYILEGQFNVYDTVTR
jgi:hypothetical protein